MKKKQFLFHKKVYLGDTKIMMNNLQNHLLLGSIVLLLSGCASAQTRRDIKMDMWLGHHYSEVVEELGNPTEIKIDITGGQLLIYKFTHNKIEYACVIPECSDDSFYNDTKETSNKLFEKNQPIMVCKFWVDEKGIIQKWTRSGTSEKDLDIITGGGYSNRYNQSKTITSFAVKGRI